MSQNEYFKILDRLRRHYNYKVHDQYLLFTMLMLEDHFEDDIINIAERESELFHFNIKQVLSWGLNHAN